MTTTDRPTASQITDDQLDALYADRDRARRIAVQLENDNRRIEDEHTEFVLRAGDRVGQVEALAELRRRDLDAATARAERAEQQLANVRAVAEVIEANGIKWAADSIRRAANSELDDAQQPSPDATDSP